MKIHWCRNFLLLTMALLSVFAKISWAVDPQKEDMMTPSTIGVTNKGVTVFVYLYNGRWWNTLSEGQRVFFIAGLQEGVTAFHVASGVGIKYIDVKDSYYANGFGPPEIASIIDDIYKDKSNIRIPVSEVLRVAVRKATGLSQQKLEDLLSGLRQTFSKHD